MGTGPKCATAWRYVTTEMFEGLDQRGEGVRPCIDGSPAVSATIELGPASADCDELWVWASDAQPMPEQLRQAGTVGRIIALEVGGEPIVISTWASARVGERFPRADALIASIDFQPEALRPSGS